MTEASSGHTERMYVLFTQQQQSQHTCLPSFPTTHIHGALVNAIVENVSKQNGFCHTMTSVSHFMSLSYMYPPSVLSAKFASL